MEISKMGFDAAGILAIYKPSSQHPLEMSATHRDFVCPAMLCFRGEADFSNGTSRKGLRSLSGLTQGGTDSTSRGVKRCTN